MLERLKTLEDLTRFPQSEKRRPLLDNIQWLDIKAAIWEIIFHAAFLSLIITTSVDYRDRCAHDFSAATVGPLNPSQTIEQMSTTEEMWDWTMTKLIPFLYEPVWWQGSKIDPSRRLVATLVSYRIGSLRIRQHRIKPDACSVPYKIYNETHCVPSWSSRHLDWTDYAEGWRDKSIHQQSESNRRAWTYSKWADVGGTHILGSLGVYPAGGYVVDLDGTAEQIRQQLELLLILGWVDERTKVVIIEATIYNPNINTFALLTAMFEFQQAGALQAKLYTYPFRIMTTINASPVGTRIFTSFTYAILTLFAIRLLQSMREMRCSYFRKFWSLAELANFLMAVAVVVLYEGRQIVAGRITEEITRKLVQQSYNFQTLAMWDQLLGILLGFSSCLATLQLLHVFQFNQRMSLLGATMRRASGQLAGFAYMLALLWAAFITFCFISFGSVVYSYSTILGTVESLMIAALGDIQYEKLQEANRVFAALFVVVYVATMFFIFLNLLITILMDAFAIARGAIINKTDRFDLRGLIVGHRFRRRHSLYHKTTHTQRFRRRSEHFDPASTYVPNPTDRNRRESKTAGLSGQPHKEISCFLKHKQKVHPFKNGKTGTKHDTLDILNDKLDLIDQRLDNLEHISRDVWKGAVLALFSTYYPVFGICQDQKNKSVFCIPRGSDLIIGSHVVDVERNYLHQAINKDNQALVRKTKDMPESPAISITFADDLKVRDGDIRKLYPGDMPTENGRDSANHCEGTRVPVIQISYDGVDEERGRDNDSDNKFGVKQNKPFPAQGMLQLPTVKTYDMKAEVLTELDNQIYIPCRSSSVPDLIAFFDRPAQTPEQCSPNKGKSQSPRLRRANSSVSTEQTLQPLDYDKESLKDRENIHTCLSGETEQQRQSVEHALIPTPTVVSQRNQPQQVTPTPRVDAQAIKKGNDQNSIRQDFVKSSNFLEVPTEDTFMVKRLKEMRSKSIKCNSKAAGSFCESPEVSGIRCSSPVTHANSAKQHRGSTTNITDRKPFKHSRSDTFPTRLTEPHSSTESEAKLNPNNLRRSSSITCIDIGKDLSSYEIYEKVIPHQETTGTSKSSLIIPSHKAQNSPNRINLASEDDTRQDDKAGIFINVPSQQGDSKNSVFPEFPTDFGDKQYSMTQSRQEYPESTSGAALHASCERDRSHKSRLSSATYENVSRKQSPCKVYQQTSPPKHFQAPNSHNTPVATPRKHKVLYSSQRDTTQESIKMNPLREFQGSYENGKSQSKDVSFDEDDHCSGNYGLSYVSYDELSGSRHS